MLSGDDLAVLPSRDYLGRFHVNFYLRDLLSCFLARKESDGRSAPEFIGNYFDTVLRGEHVLHREFDFINATPLNRRAFVSLLRNALSGLAAEANTAALTAKDFMDFVAELCPDFPASVVEEAADLAERADVSRHHFVGQLVPVDVSREADACNDAKEDEEEKCGPLLLLASLHRLVEFRLVYAEVLELVRGIFTASHLAAEPAAAAVNRRALVEEIQLRARGDLAAAALPSDQALRRMLRPPGCEGSVAESSLIGFREAVVEMSASFELALERVDPSENRVSRDLAPPQAPLPAPETVPRIAERQRRGGERQLQQHRGSGGGGGVAAGRDQKQSKGR